MRSLVVTAWFPDRDMPSRTPFVLEHCWSLQEAGQEVAVVHVVIGRARRRVVQEVYEGVPVTRTWLDVRCPGSYARTARIISRGLRGADVLHTMAFSAILLAGPSWSMRRLPWVHTEHWNGVVDPASAGRLWARLAWLRHALRLPHAVTGVTQELVGEMVRFARPGATHVVPCVVENPRDVAPFPASPPLRLVGVGAFIERKGPLLALETVARLTGRGVDVHYTMVGTGPLLESARRRAQELGIAQHVEFAGPVEPARVFEELSCAHVFFLPSSQENFFTAVAESLAAGRPAAVPLSGGFDDYCTEENSVLVDSWDPEDLADAILDAWDRFHDTDPQRIAWTVRGRFSRRTIGARFDELYHQVHERPAP